MLRDSYAAIVNNKVITIGDVLSAIGPGMERLQSRYEGRELEQKILEAYNATRDALIEAELILLDFETQGGVLPDRAIENNINTVIYERFGNDRTALLQALAESRITFTEWREQLKEQFIVQYMRRNEVTSKILVTPLDIQQAYEARKSADFAAPERVRLRLLALPATTTRANAGKIRARIQAGKNTFEQVAAKGATLQDDGEFIETASVNETFRDAIAPLAPGDVAGPVELDGTLYLVHLAERQEARVRPLEEAASEIEKDLRRAEFDRLSKIWIDSLRSKYYIQTFAHSLFD